MRRQFVHQKRIGYLRLFHAETHPIGLAAAEGDAPGRMSPLESHPCDRRTSYSLGPRIGVLQLLQRPADEDPSAINDGDHVGKHLGLGQVMRADNDRPLGGFQAGDLVADEARGFGIHGGGRLVEQEHGRIVDQGARQRQFLLHAFGVFANAAMGGLGQAEIFEQAVCSPHGGLKRSTHIVRQKIQIFDGAHAHVESVLFGENANRSADLRALGGDIVSVDTRPAAGREKKRSQHADGGGLARAVLSEQCQDLPGTDGQLDAVHCPEIGKFFA